MGSYQAALYHSISITPLGADGGGKNTWDDWHLVPTSRPKINMPSVKTNYIDIPGADGSLDLTTALTGKVTYANRQGSIEFLVMNDYGNWYDRYSNIATYLHGQEFTVVLDDDPTFYYEGRLFVNEWKSEAHWSKIVIDYNFSPYKYSSLSPKARWLWDPFRFINEGTSDTTTYKASPTTTIGGKQYKFMNIPTNANANGDQIVTYKNMVVNGTRTIIYNADLYESSPVIQASKPSSGEFSMAVTFKGKIFTWKSTGKKVLTSVALDPGPNEFIFTGNGKVTINSVGGRL